MLLEDLIVNYKLYTFSITFFSNKVVLKHDLRIIVLRVPTWSKLDNAQLPFIALSSLPFTCERDKKNISGRMEREY